MPTFAVQISCHFSQIHFAIVEAANKADAIKDVLGVIRAEFGRSATIAKNRLVVELKKPQGDTIQSSKVEWCQFAAKVTI